MPGKLIVSVHDVTPAHEPLLRRIFDFLERWGIGRTSILVVPLFHRGWDLRDHPVFADWLHALEARGHEIVLHGLEHMDVEPGKGGLYRRIMRRTYSREGEFYTLDYAAALARIRQGFEIFSEIGFAPVGFVAPAWLQNPEVLRAVKDVGLSYATSLGAIHDLRRGVVRRALTLCYSPRKRRTAVTSALYSSVLSRLLTRCELVRIAIHPGDVTHPVIVRSLEKAVARHAACRPQVTYRDLLA